jgi:hypothetical protein
MENKSKVFFFAVVSVVFAIVGALATTYVYTKEITRQETLKEVEIRIVYVMASQQSSDKIGRLIFQKTGSDQTMVSLVEIGERKADGEKKKDTPR